jgi:lauroyl/myristoyl acyltransferase
VFNGLAPKKGLHDAGFPYVHLSRPEHGFSKTRFGIRVLNPLRRKVEDRYLASRVIIRQNSGIGAMRDLRKVLADNGIVSITAGSWEGRVIVEPEVFGCRMPLATGPIALALATGAPLLPVFVWRESRTGILKVEIDAEIPLDGSGDKPAVIAGVADAYAARLQERIRAAPEQWRGWRYLER